MLKNITHKNIPPGVLKASSEIIVKKNLFSSVISVKDLSI